MKTISFSVPDHDHNEISRQARLRGLYGPSGVAKFATYQIVTPAFLEKHFISFSVPEEVHQAILQLSERKGFQTDSECTRFALYQLLTRSGLKVSRAVRHSLVEEKNR